MKKVPFAEGFRRHNLICSIIAPVHVWTSTATFLNKIQRGVKAIQGDGNCLFRALSSVICHSEDNHQQIRRILVTFSKHNKQYLKQFCHPVPIEEHINGMELDRVWGTDLEIHAAAALWQVKIYVCVPDTSFTSYSWMCYNPIPLSHLTIPVECQELPHPPGMFHFELLYAWRCHYDVIIGPHGFNPDYPPPIPDIPDVYISLQYSVLQVYILYPSVVQNINQLHN